MKIARQRAGIETKRHKVVKIIRTFRIDALVDDEMLAFFLFYQNVQTVRAAQCCCPCKSAFSRAEFRRAYFTENLSPGTIVFIEIWFWRIASGTLAFIINVTFRTSGNGLAFFAITPFDIRNVIFVIPWLIVENLRKFINLKFLVLRGMRIIESPLFKGNISADKVKKPADLFLLVLNNVK